MRPDQAGSGGHVDALHHAAVRLSGAAQAAGRTGAQVGAEAARALGDDVWLGAAARTAHRAHHRQATAAEQVAVALQHAATALDRLSSARIAADRKRAELLELAPQLGWRLLFGGLVPAHYDQPPLFGIDLGGRWTLVAEAEQAADTAAALAVRAAAGELRRLRRHLGPAALAAAVGSAQVVTLARLGVLPGVTGVPEVRPGEAAAELRRLLRLADPVAIRAYLLCLSPRSRQALVVGYPNLVGSADGAPPAMRFAANRLVLTRALAVARRGSDGAMIRRIAGWLQAGRQFLLVDLAGGRLAEVFGDLDTAAHVAVVVPGILNDLTSFDSLAADARNLHEQAGQLAAGGVATIAWLGYRTPKLLDAPFDDKAIAATHRLADLVAGLVLRAGVTTTVVAHSYGSMLLGRELRAGLRVDAVVALGSPGMSAATAAGLHAAPGTRVYAGRAPGDYVSLSENFGRDPSDPRFGAIRIATRGADGTGPVGHTSYFTGQSECTHNLARIVSGHYDAVTVLPPSPAEQAAGAADTVRSVALASGPAMLLSAVDALAQLFPRSLRAPAETAVEATQRLEHLDERLTDPDLPIDALDNR